MDGLVTGFISMLMLELGAAAVRRGVRPDHDRLHAEADAGAVGESSWLRHVRSLVLRCGDPHVSQPLLLPRRIILWLRGEHLAAGGRSHKNDAEKLFDRLDAARLTRKVYSDAWTR
jgi:hypothetical protein